MKRVLRGSLLGMAAAAIACGAVAGIRFAFPLSNRALAQGKPPTLEATRHSTIDAQGAEIPEDFPGELARADDNSLIQMNGLKVKKRSNGGYALIPGTGTIEKPLPPPEGEIAWMSAPDLKNAILGEAKSLRELQQQFNSDYFGPDHAFPSDEKASEVSHKYAEIFTKTYAPKVTSLASAAVNYIGGVNSTQFTREERYGMTIVLYRKFVGPEPATNAAAFLEALARRLPPS